MTKSSPFNLNDCPSENIEAAKDFVQDKLLDFIHSRLRSQVDKMFELLIETTFVRTDEFNFDYRVSVSGAALIKLTKCCKEIKEEHND